MPRFYPNNDCDFYAERLIDSYHNEKRHVLRSNPLKNPVRWFHDQDDPDPNRSFICSWGIKEDFKTNTGWKCDKFIATRIRSIAPIPTAGRPGLWRITRVGPCGFGKLPPHTWSLEAWLKSSSFRESKTPEISKSSSWAFINVTATKIKTHHQLIRNDTRFIICLFSFSSLESQMIRFATELPFS